jgi:hypothetical protein
MQMIKLGIEKLPSGIAVADATPDKQASYKG